MIFQDANNIVFIQDIQGKKFSCPSSEFAKFEPTYNPLTSPYIVRMWSEDKHYISTGDTQTEDPFYTYLCLADYCSKINIYQVAYDIMHPTDEPEYITIYVALTITGGDNEPIPAIYPNDTSDPILQMLTFAGAILSDPDDETSIIPFSYIFRVPVFQVSREQFAWERYYNPTITGSFQQQVDIINGEFILTAFTRTAEGVYMISDDSFELIDGALFGYDGLLYKVSIIDGPKFFKVISDEKIKKDK